MAAWMMQRRLLSLFTSSRRHHISFRNDSSPQYLSSFNPFLHGERFYNRQIRTFSETINPIGKNAESSTSSADADPVGAMETAEVNFTAKSELKVSPRHDHAVMFTCKVCETKSVKTISRESYEKGVVVARCGGCNNNHLIVDHLWMFGEKGNIKDILAARGEEVRRGSSDTLNLTLEDLVGTRK